MIYWLQEFDNSPLPHVPDHIDRLYGLVLNPMRGRCEEARFLAASESREELECVLRDERAEQPYKDEQWQKTYRRGGPLEWFNPPWDDGNGSADQFGCGIIELRKDGWRRVA